MKGSRTEQVNRALTERRRLMQRRIFTGRLCLLAWAVLSALNLVLAYGSNVLRLPVSCISADLLMMLHFLHPDTAGSGLWMIPAALLPVGMVLAAFWWNREKAELARKAVFLLLWLDVVLGLAAYIWDPAILFGSGDKQLTFALLNLAGHILLVWRISRARRAVDSLDVLPQSEIEGDPFEEFTKARREGD